MPAPKDPIKRADWIKKISLSRIGRSTIRGIPKTEDHKRKLRDANLGKKASEETKLKMSLKRRGKDNPAWKGKITIKCINLWKRI
jgi:hypothetical protein